MNLISLIFTGPFKWSIPYWTSYGSLYFFEELVHFIKLSNFCV